MAIKYIAFVLVAAVVFGLDQLGKRFVEGSLAIGEHVPLVSGLIGWTYRPEAGGALGFFRGWAPEAELAGYAVLSFVVLIVSLVFLRSLAPRDFGTTAALGALVGGVASNGIDRYRLGSTIDFIHLGPAASSLLPDFNFADLAVLLGVGTLIIELLANEMAARAAERPRRAPPY